MAVEDTADSIDLGFYQQAKASMSMIGRVG